MDYNVKPCKIDLTEFDMEVVPSIKMTGLGFTVLNSGASKVISTAIPLFVRRLTKNQIQAILDSFDCEILRP